METALRFRPDDIILVLQAHPLRGPIGSDLTPG